MITKVFKQIFYLSILCLFFGSSLISCESDSFDHQPQQDGFILSFTLNGHKAEINQETGEIIINLPYEEDITNLSPKITLSTDASILPSVETTMDFSSPVRFTVKSKDGSLMKEYTVVVKQLLDAIQAFQVETNGDKYLSIIDHEEGKINVYLPGHVTDWSQLKSLITLPEGASISPANGTVMNLSKGRTFLFTVKYQGTSKAYRVSAVETPAPTIESITAGDAIGEIDQQAKTISFSFSPDLDITNLQPTIELKDAFNSAQVVEPIDFMKGTDFSKLTQIKIRSEISGEAIYSVSHTRNIIINYFAVDINGRLFEGKIDNDNMSIQLDVPFFADITNLKAVINANTTMATVSPASGTILDFSNQQTYTINYPGYNKSYTVDVTYIPAKTGFLTDKKDAISISNGNERKAYNWFINNVDNGECVSMQDIKNGTVDLNFYKVLWWQYDDNTKLPQIALDCADKIKEFHQKGHQLFLSTYAVQYIKELGIQKDGGGPTTVGVRIHKPAYASGLNIDMYQNHPIFNGPNSLIISSNTGDKRLLLMSQNVQRQEHHAIWVMKLAVNGGTYDGIVDWRTKTGGIDLAGREWQTDRADYVDMAEFPKNNKGEKEGTVLCLGSPMYEWDVDDTAVNQYHSNIENLTKNCISYLENQY